MPNARTSHGRETQARRPLIASPGETGAPTRALPTALVGGNTNPTWEDRPSERDAAGGNACIAGLCCCTKPGARLTPHPVTHILASGQGRAGDLLLGRDVRPGRAEERAYLPARGSRRLTLCLGTEHHYHLPHGPGAAGKERRQAGGSGERLEWLFMLC